MHWRGQRGGWHPVFITISTTDSPVAPRFARGLREGQIRTRAAANGAPATASFDASALTFEFTLLTSRSCRSYRYILSEGDLYSRYTEV